MPIFWLPEHSTPTERTAAMHVTIAHAPDEPRGTIVIFREAGWWHADFTIAEHAEDTKAVMNCTVLPLPFGARVPSARVIPVLAHMNPRDVICVRHDEPTAVPTPLGTPLGY